MASGEKHSLDDGSTDDRDTKRVKAGDGSVASDGSSAAVHVKQVFEKVDSLCDEAKMPRYLSTTDVESILEALSCIGDRERARLHYHRFSEWDAAYRKLTDHPFFDAAVATVLFPVNLCLDGMCTNVAGCRLREAIALAGTVKANSRFSTGIRPSHLVQRELAVFGWWIPVGNMFHASEDVIPRPAYETIIDARPEFLMNLSYASEYCETKALFHCVSHASRGFNAAFNRRLFVGDRRFALVAFAEGLLSRGPLQLSAFIAGGVTLNSDTALTGPNQSVAGVLWYLSQAFPLTFPEVFRGRNPDDFPGARLTLTRIRPALTTCMRRVVDALECLHVLEQKFLAPWAGLVLAYLGASFRTGMDVILAEAAEIIGPSCDTSWHAAFVKSTNQWLSDPKIEGSLIPGDPLVVKVPPPPPPQSAENSAVVPAA